MQVAQTLERTLPGIEVLGSTYPLSAAQAAAAKAIGAAQLAALALALAGDRIFATLALPPPPWYARVAENRPTAALGAWLVGNMAASSVASTGAFEIYFDGGLVRRCEKGVLACFEASILTWHSCMQRQAKACTQAP